MSFKEKLSCFSNAAKNQNQVNKQKFNNAPILFEKSANTKDKIQLFRNTTNKVIRLSKILDKKPNYKAPELDHLNSLKKIIKLQEDLKTVDSIKKQFEGNQKKMFEKLNNFCFNYHKNKINMKKTFDYCCDHDSERSYEYRLLTIPQSKNVLKEKELYDSVFNFMFLIRNDNKLMLKIIDKCENEGYEDISDFLVNFCYEDTINSSFIQEDLLLLIYLLTEKCIIKSFPNLDELKNQNQNDINIYDNYVKKNIVYYIYLSLTRKADIRNYLCSILPENILAIENLRLLLSVEIGRITEYLNSLDERKRMFAENRNTTMKPENYKGNSGYLKRLSASTFLESNLNSKKLKSRLTLQTPDFPVNIMKSDENNEILRNNSERNSEFAKLSLESNKIKSENNLNTLNDLDNDKAEVGLDIIEVEEEEIEKNDTNIDVIFDPFFKTTETTLDYIKNKLKEYENINPEDKNNNLNSFNENTIIAMKEYLNHLIRDYELDDIKIEKYSNEVLINSLVNTKNIKSENSFDFIVNTIKANHQSIIEIIIELLKVIKENIHSLPFFIKCILNSIDILLNYKYKNKLSLYNKYMIKANFLLGNVIIPVFGNPCYNGIITNEIISIITKENLEIITSIINKSLSGTLFYIGMEPCMTIFNQFIIEIIPMIFEIIQKTEENFKLPEIIKTLTDSIKEIDNEKRDINYNFFEQNTDEKFQFQSICFSYNNIIDILSATTKYKEEMNEYEKNVNKEKKEKMKNNIGKQKEEINENEIQKQKNKDIIEAFLKTESTFTGNLNRVEKIEKQCKEYIFMSKINLLDTFESKIQSILKDIFIGLNAPIKEKFKTEEVSRFKKCLSEVLTYVDLIRKEYIPIFIELKKENYIHDQNLIDLLTKYNEKKMYENIMNGEIYEDKTNDNKSLDEDDNEEEDPNFKTQILPFILLKLKSELGSNSTDDLYQRMLYCCSYLQLHIDLLPPEYILDNYKLLFVELIKDTESNLHILRNNILNQLNMKVKGSEKTNMIISNTYQQIKNMEKFKCIQYLDEKLKISTKFNVPYHISGNGIKTVIYDENGKEMPLNTLFDGIPDYRKFENETDDIIELEEKTNMGEALKNYFKNLKTLIRKQNIVKKYSKDDIESICNELENYILIKLYKKLYPSRPTKMDIKFYNKCCRLDFIKPENLIKDKNMVNENLWKTSMKYINEMDNKYTPADKIKCIAKAFSILQNSITFCSGKNELGVDDTIKPMIYILIKSKPKNIFSNFNYSQLYLDPDLSKKQYGILLTQICMIMNIIKDMKHTELFDVTEEQFGKDEE